MTHDFTKATVAGKAYCIHCGRMCLRNPLTAWCVKKGCDYKEDPGFRRALATLPAQHRGE